MNYISRPLYIEKIKPFINQSLIKVLIGQRRVGKSYLLRQLQDIIKEQFPEKQIIYINKEQHDYADIKNADDLILYINQKRQTDNIALFIDEVQDILSFETALRDLVTRPGYDLYCTGSNAKLLSGELASHLSGRYIETKVYGLSYQEFLVFHRQSDSVESFLNYLKYGGLPYLIHLDMQAEVVYEYLKAIYNTIVLKDIVTRYKIRNVTFLENLINFTADNIGSIVSAKKISNFLKSQRINISTQLVLDYLQYLETSFLINKVRRSDLQGKKYFEIGEKYYFEDIGIRNSIVGFKPNDIHKLLENIVYLHLKMAGYAVTVGVENHKEIDFIAKKNGEIIYVQVAYLLLNKETIEREFGNLLKIKDNYPKYVVTMDTVKPDNTLKGIIQMHIKDFCLNIL